MMTDYDERQHDVDIDDDDGIDERYDGYGEDSGDEPDDYLNDEMTSPKAPKPKP